MSVSVCMSASFYPSVCLSVRLSVPPAVRLLSVCLAGCRAVSLSLCVPLRHSASLPVWLSVRPSVCPSACLSVGLSVCVFLLNVLLLYY